MKDLIESIVQALVDNPEQVEVLEVKTESVSVFELSVAKKILGKLSVKRAGLLKQYGLY